MKGGPEIIYYHAFFITMDTNFFFSSCRFMKVNTTMISDMGTGFTGGHLELLTRGNSEKTSKVAKASTFHHTEKSLK